MILRDEYKRLYEAGRLPFVEVPTVIDEKFYLDRCRYYYGLYAYDALGIGYGGIWLDGPQRRYFRDLRDHARGLQNVEKYKDLLDPKDKRNRRKWNISWDPIAILPKFRDIIKSKFMDMTLIPHTRAIDEMAAAERSLIKNTLKFESSREHKMYLQAAGFQPSMEQIPGVETPEDVESLYELGGIRLAVEMMMKDGIDKVLYDSGWEVLKEMLIEDIIDLGAFAVDEVLQNGVLKYKYVDPARVLCRPSIYPDYRDSDFRGYVEYTKISELRGAIGLGEEDLKTLQKMYGNYQTSNILPSYRSWDYGYREDYSNFSSNLATYNDFGVEVMTIYFVDTHVQNYLVGRHPRGSRIFDEVGPDFELTDRMKKQGKEIEQIPLQYIFKCRWICGTDIVFDYGPVDRIMRQDGRGSKQVRFPMTLFISHEPSLIERCISFDDDIQLANYKIRSMLAKLPPAPRMIIDKSRMRDGVSIGQEEYSILEMITNYQTDGIMVVESLEEYALPGAENDNASRQPFTLVNDTGITQDLQILEQRIQLSVDKIRQVTGVSEVSDGTTKRPDILKSVAEGLQRATNSALKPHMKLFVDGFREMCKNTMLRIQQFVLMGVLDMGSLPVGEGTFRQVLLSGELANHDWNIMVDLLSYEDKQVMMQELFQRKETIPEDSWFAIYNAISSNDIRKAQLLLTKAVQRSKEERLMEQQMMIEKNAEAQAQAAQAAQQARVQAEQLLTQTKIQFEQFMAEVREQENIRKHMREKELTQLREMLKRGTAIETVRENNQNRLET